MEALSRFGARAGAAVVAAVLAGCATGPEPEPVPEVEHFREILVQTIPRGGYIERNNEYIGVAPIKVRVRTSESGYPRGPSVVIWATDTPTGGYVWRRLQRGEPVPERMLLDIRPFLEARPALSFGP
jgi:hypothetical protein